MKLHHQHCFEAQNQLVLELYCRAASRLPIPWRRYGGSQIRLYRDINPCRNLQFVTSQLRRARRHRRRVQQLARGVRDQACFIALCRQRPWPFEYLGADLLTRLGNQVRLPVLAVDSFMAHDLESAAVTHIRYVR